MLKKIITILLNISLVLVSLGQLTRITWPGQPVFFYAFEPLIFIVTVLMMIHIKKVILCTPLVKMIGAFLGFALFSLIISSFWYSTLENIIALLYLLRLSTYLVFVAVSIQYFQDEKIQKYSSWLIHGVAVGILISSLVQYFLYQNLGNLAYLGWDPHLYRLVGLFFDPPMTIAVFVLCGLYYFLSSSKTVKTRVMNWSMVALFLLVSFLTYSRGGYLGIVAVIAVMIMRSKELKLIVFSMAIIILGFLLLPKGQSEGINLLRTTSIGARVSDYQTAISIWRKSPITGIGYNHIRPEKDPYESQAYYGPYNPSHGSTAFHSSFLVILVTTGVIGLAVFFILLFQLANQSPYFLYSILFLSVISLFDNVLLHPFTLMILGYLGSVQKYQSSRS